LRFLTLLLIKSTVENNLQLKKCKLYAFVYMTMRLFGLTYLNLITDRNFIRLFGRTYKNRLWQCWLVFFKMILGLLNHKLEFLWWYRSNQLINLPMNFLGTKSSKWKLWRIFLKFIFMNFCVSVFAQGDRLSPTVTVNPSHSEGEDQSWRHDGLHGSRQSGRHGLAMSAMTRPFELVIGGKSIRPDGEIISHRFRFFTTIPELSFEISRSISGLFWKIN
jgi:hypothetical protein